MPRFIVHVDEIVTTSRSKEFEAESEQVARDMAEAEDWREWGHDHTETSSAIDYIEEE